MNLFNLGKVRLHSGTEADWKIDCDALTQEDWDALAYIVSQRIHFNQVIGIPAGGLKFAEALRKYSDTDSRINLIVDDVLTTGKSMEEFHHIYPDHFGLVLFSRLPRAKVPSWIDIMFSLWSY